MKGELELGEALLRFHMAAIKAKEFKDFLEVKDIFDVEVD